MRFSVLHIALLLLLPLIAGVASAQPVGPTTPIILEHADVVNGTVVNGEEINEFIGSVAITQGVTHITADRAVLNRNTNYVVFTGNVVMTQPNVRLSAPQADYDGRTRVASGTGGVRLEESGAVMDAAAGEYNMNTRVATFRGGVRLRDSNATLDASYGEYYQDDRHAAFHGGVRVENDSGTLMARDFTYWRDSREAFAVGDVILTPKDHGAVLTGDTLRNQPSRNYTLVLGRPKLVQIDTVDRVDSAGNVRRDTTVITARKMEAFRGEHEEYVGTDSVRLHRGDLVAIAAFGRYLPKEEVIGLGAGRARPSAGADSSRSDSTRADSSKPSPGQKSPPRSGTPSQRDTLARRDTSHVDTTAGADAVAGVRPAQRAAGGSYPVIWYGDSQLTGDTVTVRLQQKKLHRLDADRNAFAVTKGKLNDRFDQLAGERILFAVSEDTVRQVRSEGLASSIYFVYDSDRPNGVNRASGDTINVGFDNGEASRIAVFGKRSPSEGEYFPEQDVAGQEGSYRLAGFVWFERDGTASALKGSLPRGASGPAEGESDQKKGSGSGVRSRPR